MATSSAAMASNLRPGLQGFRDVLAEVSPNFGAVQQLTRTLDSPSFYNFYFHEFLFPTEAGGYRAYLTDKALDTLDAVQALVGIQDTALVLDLLTEVEAAIRHVVRHYRRRDWDEQGVVRDLLDGFYAQWTAALPDMLAAYRVERTAGIAWYLLEFVRNTVIEYVRERLYSWYPSFVGFWSDWPSYFLTGYAYWHEWVYRDPTEGLPDWAGEKPISFYEQWRREGRRGSPSSRENLPFEVFDEGSVNVGLRLVYRQDWSHLGTQPGEIIKTVPLGPGEKVRVAVKVTRRSKQSSTLDSTTSTETERESQDSTKDSSEIVREASESSNWNVSATASAGFLFGSVSVTAGAGGASEEKSRHASSSLSEAMQKTASKTRSETKVQVLRESEDVSEFEHISEISNPNNESAITYEYHKLQHQYEVFSYLAEVQAVIYVAEPLPTIIDAEFIRRFDWIIARVLKDESYRNTLNELIQAVDENATIDPRWGSMFDQVKDTFATFDPKGGGGVSIPDIYGQTQRSYQEEVRAAASRDRATQLRQLRQARLFRHIEDNLLHYCQAIWAAEPSDQRLLRYKKEGRSVPIEWSGPLVVRAAGAGTALSSFAVTGREAPLWELLDPTGPLGYIGNYAVFAIRPQTGHYELSSATSGKLGELRVALGSGQVLLGLQEVLALSMAPYVDPLTGMLIDPALRLYQRRATAVNLADLRRLTDDQVFDVLSYLPNLAGQLLDGSGNVVRAGSLLSYQISRDEWGDYLYRMNNTRHFLLDSNNVYLNIRVSGGAALEPFKRAHRLLDVLKADAELEAEQLKNDRRRAQLAAGGFDPDIEKVVIVGDPATASAAAGSFAGSTATGVGGSAASSSGSGTAAGGAPGGG